MDQTSKNIIENLDEDRQSRLNLIKQEVSNFLRNQASFGHFVYQDPAIIERLHLQKLYELAAELPENKRLSPDEVYIMSAAAWLYEIGLQSPDLSKIIGNTTSPLTDEQKMLVWKNRHQLSYEMLLKSIKNEDDAILQLPLRRDLYSQAIAEVCLHVTSHKPLSAIDDTFVVEGGFTTRLRLMVALLRLADQFNIDSSRINADMLANVNIPISEKARWWAYHYTQTFPLQNGRMRFHYTIPVEQKNYINHIRALVEPQFRIETNETMRYLLNSHDIRLQLDPLPEIKTDSQGFRQPIPIDVAQYLRQEVTPERPITDIDKRVSTDDEITLIIVDYENFIIQLGKLGYFLGPAEQRKALFNMLQGLSSQYLGRHNHLIAAHWQQPHMERIRDLLTTAFDLFVLQDNVSSDTALISELDQRFHNGIGAKKLVFIAPCEGLNRSVRQANDRLPTYVWIADLPEDVPYKLSNNNHRFIDLLELPTIAPLTASALSASEIGCILWLVDHGNDQYSMSELHEGLRAIEGVIDTSYWIMWLENKGILRYRDNFYRINREHPAVNTVLEQRGILIETLLQLTAGTQSNIPQNILIEKLPLQNFPYKENIPALLNLFHGSKLIYRQVEGENLFYGLNDQHPAVVSLNRELYVTLFVLGFDHFCLTKGYRFMHVDYMAQDISAYLSSNFFQTIFAYTKHEKIIIVSKDNRGRETAELNIRHKAVWTALLKADIIFSELFRNKNGMERLSLQNRLSEIRRFNYDASEFNTLLQVLSSERLIEVDADGTNRQRDLIRLRVEDRLVKNIVGRWNLTALVKSMRILARQNPTPSDVINNLAQYEVHSKDLAGWTFDYGKLIKLVQIQKQNEKDIAELRRDHSIIRELDGREARVKTELQSLMQSNKVWKQKDGWVAEYHLKNAMAETVDTFGYLREEHQYWINLCINRKIIERKTDYHEQDRRRTTFIRLRQENGK